MANASPHPIILERLFERAVESHRTGRTAEAEEAYRALLTVAPRHAPALHLLGVLRLQENDAPAAAALIVQALALAPEAADYHLNLGVALEQGGEMAAAEAAYRRTLGLRPDLGQALRNLGTLLNRRERPAEALASLRHATAVDPDHPTTTLNLVATLLKLDDGAAAVLWPALGEDPRFSSTWGLLGEALGRQERFPQALAAFERALALAPGAPQAEIGRATTLEALGRVEEAFAVVDALAPMAEHADALLAIGAGLFEAGHEDKALTVYRRFASLTPKRGHYPGHPARIVSVRPAAAVCRERGWPHRIIAEASPLRVVADDGGAGASPTPTPPRATATAYTYDLPEVFVAFAEEAVILPRLHAPLVGGDTLLVDGFNTNSRASLALLPHIVWHSRAERMLLDLPEPGVWIEEESVLLGGGPNWSHGVLDWLSKLVALERCPALAGLPVLIDPATPRSILDLAEMLGLARERMRPLPHEGGVVAGRRLWLPSLTHDYKFTSPLHLDFLRRRLAGVLAEGRARKRRRLFLSRRQAGYRALVNEAEVLAALAPFGVEAVAPEDFPMAEQIRLFASAELIIGPLGGGSAAMVFAAPGAGFVELTHDKMILNQYAILCGLLGQRFRRIVGTVGASRGQLVFDHDFTVSPDAVVAAVQGLLDTGPDLDVEASTCIR